MKYKLVAMIGIQDEEPYLAQWLEFHLLQGFDHFYVYNNDSTDGFRETLAPYVTAGIVEIINVPHALFNKGAGMWIMQDAVARAKREAEWMLATSIDEYTFCSKGMKVSDFVDPFYGFGGVAISWVMFNSSGELTTDHSRLVIEKYTHTYREGTPHVKTICRPQRVVGIRDPHSYYYEGDFHAVNERGKFVFGAHVGEPSTHVIRMHHYWTMSKEEFEVKMGKGRSDIAGLEGKRRDGADDLWAAAHDPVNAMGESKSACPWSTSIRLALERRFK